MQRPQRFFECPLVIALVLAAGAAGSGACAPEVDAVDETEVAPEALAGWTNSQSWMPLTSPNALAAGGVGISRRNQLADVWASGPDQSLARNTRSAVFWSGWQTANLGPMSNGHEVGLVGAPSAIGFDGFVRILARDRLNDVQWTTWNNIVNSWDAWTYVGATHLLCEGNPVLAVGPTGEHLWAFSLSGGRLASSRRVAGSWSAWGFLTAPAPGYGSSPAAVGNPNVTEVVVRGFDGHVWERSLGPCPGGGSNACWSPVWNDLGVPAGASFVGTPAVAFTTTTPATIVIFALGSNGNVYSYTAASGWTLHRAAVAGAVAAANSGWPTLAAQFRGTTPLAGLDLVEIGSGNVVSYSSAFQ